MKKLKVHIKLNDKAVCGAKAKRLRFATDAEPSDCRRCAKVVEK